MTVSTTWSLTTLEAEGQGNGYTAGSQFGSDVIGLANGGYAVAYGNPDATFGAFSAVSLRDSAFFPTATNGPHGPGGIDMQGDPAMVRLANGNIAIVWDEGPGSAAQPASNDVVGAILNPVTGALIHSEFTVSFFPEHADPEVAALTNGNWVVAMTNGETIVLQLMSPAGARIGGLFFTGTSGTDIDPVLVGLADGGFALAFTENISPSGSTSRKYVQTFDADGAPRTPAPAPIGAQGPGGGKAVAALPNGNVALVYDGIESGASGLFLHIVTSTGANLFGPIRVDTTTTQESNPDVTVLPDGQILVAWEDNFFEDGNILARLFSSTGVPVAVNGSTNPFIITESDRFDDDPSIAQIRQGVFVTSWTDSETDGSGGGISTAVNEIFATITSDGQSDTIVGSAIRDVIVGGGGNDTLNGGGGVDVASFTGARGNYLVHTFKAPGGVAKRVKDGAGSDGNDFLVAIETLRFPSGDVTRFGAQQNLTANVDGARFDDVVYRKVSNGQVVFQNMTNGAPTGFDAITAPLSSAWKAIGTGDVTGDGKADVFIWNSATGQVFSAAPGASGAPTYAVIASGIAGNFAAVGTGDIDGDGFTDLVVRDAGNGAITWRPMTGGSPDAFKPVGAFGPTWTYQGTGDVNRDGFADVAIRSAAGQVVLVNMANGAPSGFIDLGNVSGFRVGAIADLNADGFDDVVLQNEANGQVIWRNLSGSGAPWNVATDPLGTSFLLRRGADVDNDGSADLIFQHATTGETIFRAMDAGVGTGWGTVSTPLGTDFLVV